ncbi:ABC transporter ATP-binding protein [Patulibacter sp. NPDC049589]|uniref:ABC transporter ATP-binding protein n=1 Tax=Patulibacter sp. NPDC049589 TaxID=3154731 RepID=UPI00341575D8
MRTRDPAVPAVPAVPAAEIRGLTIAQPGTDRPVVDDVSLAIRPGEVLALVGESGSGKTTTALALLGHVRRGARVVAGSALVGGRDVLALPPRELRAVRGRAVSYVPQDPASSLNPALRIGTQLDQVIAAHLDAPRDERRERARTTLADVALPHDRAFLRRFPHQLSGGQQQRVAIAIAVACRPAVVAFDEPTTGLDVTTQAHVLATIRELCRTHGLAALYVSHDLAVVAQIAGTVAVLREGRIVERGPVASVLHEPEHAYVRALLDAHRSVGRPRSRGTRGPAEASPAPAPSAPEPPAPEPSGAVLAVTGLVAVHGRATVVDDVALHVRRDECLAIVGESGSGKTTLARCIAGLHRPAAGTVTLDGVPLAPLARDRSREHRGRVQYVFQNPYASLNPRRTIGDTVDRGLVLFSDEPRRRRAARTADLLARVELPAGVAERLPEELSGGERQRVAIARALAADPDVLVCDEITSALDVSVQASVLGLLDELRRERRLAVLFITHDLAVVRSVADRVLIVRHGRAIETAATEDVFTAPATEDARRLVADSPRLDRGPAVPPPSSLLAPLQPNG